MAKYNVGTLPLDAPLDAAELYAELSREPGGIEADEARMILRSFTTRANLEVFLAELAELGVQIEEEEPEGAGTDEDTPDPG